MDSDSKLTEWIDNLIDKAYGEDFKENLAETVDLYLEPGVIDILHYPEKYREGSEQKKKLIKNLESLYSLSCRTRKFAIGEKVFDRIYELFEIDPNSINHLGILDSYLSHIYSMSPSNKDKVAARKLFNILEYLFHSCLEEISEIKTSSEGKEKESVIVSFPKIIKAMLVFGDWHRDYNEEKISYTRILLRTIVMEEKYGKLGAQIFGNEYYKIRHTVAGSIINIFVDETERKGFMEATGTEEHISGVLKYATEHALPYEIGCYFIGTDESAPEVYATFQSTYLDVRFRLYALKILSAMADNEDDLMFKITSDGQAGNSLMRMLTSSDPNAVTEEYDKLYKLKQESKGVPVMTDEQRKELAVASDEIIRSDMYKESHNPFSNNIDAQVLLSALVLRSSELADVDIIESLNAMPDILSFNNSPGGLQGIGLQYQRVQDQGRHAGAFHDQSFFLQDVAAVVRADEKEHLCRFIDALGSFLVLKTDSNQTVENVKTELKNQYGITNP